jgi:small subunit ribosomal protein S4
VHVAQPFGFAQHVQHGDDLGARMQHAFVQGFATGHAPIVIIGSDLPGLTTKTSAKRPTVPGMHGPTKRMNKTSEYGLRLKEKQKLRLHYGLTERSMRLVFQRAQRMAGDTGRNMIGLLESRFDNLVWRAGLTRTIPAARQLIGHGHINLHGKRAKTPSQSLSVGDVFQVREASRNREDLRITANSPVRERPAEQVRTMVEEGLRRIDRVLAAL